jgi:hypothetical protein
MAADVGVDLSGFLEPLGRFCDDVIETRADTDSVRALIAIVLADWNAMPLTTGQFEGLFTQPGWPAPLPRVTDETIRGFAQGRQPADRLSLASYLYVIWLLVRSNHPCLRGLGPRAFLASSEPFRAFKALLGLGGAPADGGFPAGAKVMGDGLYTFLSEFNGVDLGKVLASALFSVQEKPGGKPKLMVTETENEYRVAAIRFGVKGRFVSSSLRFTLICGQGGRPEYIYVTTWVKGQTDGPRSRGFVIPRDGEMYIVQYHIDGVGLNVTSVAFGQLRAETYFKGLVMAVDREGNERALASRMVLIPERGGESLLEDLLNTKQLEAKLRLWGLGDVAQEITDYLRDEDNKVIKILTPEESSPVLLLQTWNDIKQRLSDPDSAARTGVGDENSIRGYATRALVSE